MNNENYFSLLKSIEKGTVNHSPSDDIFEEILRTSYKIGGKTVDTPQTFIMRVRNSPKKYNRKDGKVKYK